MRAQTLLAEPGTYRICTPEGVNLSFQVATVGDRTSAFLLDLAIIVLTTLAIGLLAILSGGETGIAFTLVASFLLFNFYFSFFELRWSGQTYGKRQLGLRVIARDGGSLSADMILARNLMRDLEFYLPLTALAAPETLIPQGRGWGVLVGLGWIFVFALMPFFGKYRLRCGDLIAGTMVVREPKTLLLSDLTLERPIGQEKDQTESEEFVFSTQQLNLYGIYELQILEDLFRRHGEGQASKELLNTVCEKIKKKIEWPRGKWNVDTLRFLRSFYKAQRAHLEKKLLFGERKEQKSSKQVPMGPQG